MGSQKERESIMGREGEVAGCSLYKRMKENSKEGRESTRGMCHRPVEQRRKSGRKKYNKRVNDCRISVLKCKTLK